jgi:hypothetical protein
MTENSKLETPEYSNKWKDLPCSCVGKLNIILVSFPRNTYLNIQHSFNQYCRRLYYGMDKLNLKCICKSQGTRKSETTLRKRKQFWQDYCYIFRDSVDLMKLREWFCWTWWYTSAFPVFGRLRKRIVNSRWSCFM